MMDNARYRMELMALNQVGLPSGLYRFFNVGTPDAYVVMAARTRRGNVYTLQIELANFPETVPPVYVKQMLHDKDGVPMDGCSCEMHTLTSKNNWTRICHYGYDSWTPSVSLYKIYVKACLWLEIYEQHLKSGKPIDYYLSHQQ